MLRNNFYLSLHFSAKAEKHFADMKYPCKVTLSIIDIFRRIEAREVPMKVRMNGRKEYFKF